jgi:glycerol-3-phosphate dehydrogenase
MAIAAGMAKGLGYGDNSMAALVTRALAELTRLGIALGGNPLTYAGLAGMGDLIATCFSELSRNRRVGVELGRGRSLAEITGEMKMVAEGVKTTSAVLDLAERHGLDMPIAKTGARRAGRGVDDPGGQGGAARDRVREWLWSGQPRVAPAVNSREHSASRVLR